MSTMDSPQSEMYREDSMSPLSDMCVRDDSWVEELCLDSDDDIP